MADTVEDKPTRNEANCPICDFKCRTDNLGRHCMKHRTELINAMDDTDIEKLQKNTFLWKRREDGAVEFAVCCLCQRLPFVATKGFSKATVDKNWATYFANHSKKCKCADEANIKKVRTLYGSSRVELKPKPVKEPKELKPIPNRGAPKPPAEESSAPEPQPQPEESSTPPPPPEPPKNTIVWGDLKTAEESSEPNPREVRLEVAQALVDYLYDGEEPEEDDDVEDVNDIILRVLQSAKRLGGHLQRKNTQIEAISEKLEEVNNENEELVERYKQQKQQMLRLEAENIFMKSRLSDMLGVPLTEEDFGYG